MEQKNLLELALRSSASIHQPHALKAYLAACNLNEAFQWGTPLWQQTADLIGHTEITSDCDLSSHVDAPEFSEARIHSILTTGVFPAAYAAMKQWHQRAGFQQIAAHYVAIASQENEYLSHNITILLALSSVYEIIDDAQRPLFLNRLTEFVCTTFHSQTLMEQPKVAAIDTQLLLISCLQQPDFFGHNLITLSWLLRQQSHLSTAHFNAMSAHLLQLATTPLMTATDSFDYDPMAAFDQPYPIDDFQADLHALCFGVSHNLHQITLADALFDLQQRFPQHTAALAQVAQLMLLKIQNHR